MVDVPRMRSSGDSVRWTSPMSSSASSSTPSRGDANQPEVGEHVPLAAQRRRETPGTAAPQQPFPRQRDCPRPSTTASPKLTFGTCLASAGASKNGYSLKPNIFAVTLAGTAAATCCTPAPLVVAHPLDGDAVLGARQLVHQPVELLVRLELRVVLDDGQQAAERRRLLVGRLRSSPRATWPRAAATARRRCP